MNGAALASFPAPDVAQTRDARDPVQRQQLVELGVWMFLSTVVMLFAAFTSALIVRSSGTDWRPVELPPVLWLNTAVLAASSVMLELGRAAGRRRAWASARGWMSATLGLGLVFLAGQVAAWQALWGRGVYLPGNAFSAFFYILTGLHAGHLVAGLLVLAVAAVRLVRLDRAEGAVPPVLGEGVLRIAATFWHFFGALWLYLFAVLSMA
jgi:cytochrome c oxidase subunit 3